MSRSSPNSSVGTPVSQDFAPRATARPLGIWVVSALYASLAALGLYSAIDQFVDPFVFEGQEYTMWSEGAGLYVVTHMLLTLGSAVALLAGKRLARIGIMAALFVAFCAVGYDTYSLFLMIQDERPAALHSLHFWWSAARFPTALLVLSALTAWYLFGDRTRSFFGRLLSQRP